MKRRTAFKTEFSWLEFFFLSQFNHVILDCTIAKHNNFITDLMRHMWKVYRQKKVGNKALRTTRLDII